MELRIFTLTLVQFCSKAVLSRISANQMSIYRKVEKKNIFSVIKIIGPPLQCYMLWITIKVYQSTVAVLLYTGDVSSVKAWNVVSVTCLIPSACSVLYTYNIYRRAELMWYGIELNSESCRCVGRDHYVLFLTQLVPGSITVFDLAKYAFILYV